MADNACAEPGCAFVGKSPVALQMHTQRKHRGMGNQGNGTRKAARPRKVASKALVPVKAKASRRTPTPRVWTELPGFKLLDDGRGGTWLAEKIR